MSEIFEAWTMPGEGGATPTAMTKKIGAIPIVRRAWTNPRNKVGSGRITVHADYAELDTIITVDPDDHTNDQGSMIRIRLDGTAAGDEDYSFIAEHISDPYEEAGDRLVDISGPGREKLLDDGVVFPYDFPGPNGDGTLTYQPDWIYGGKNVLKNSGFEESQEITTGTGDERTATGDFRPTHWDISRDPITGVPHGNIDNPTDQPEEDGFTAEDAGAGVTPDEGTYLGQINPLDMVDGGRYSGIQQIVRVKPGFTYTARIKAYSGAAPTFGWRFIMRTLEEKIVAGAEPAGVGSYDELDLTPTSTWVQYGPVEFVVPADVDQLIFRMGLTTGTGNPTPVRFDTGELNEGIDPANAGEIWQDLLDDVTADHVSEPTAPDRDRTLQYLKYDGFSTTLDSSGAAWVDDLSLTIKVGKRLLQVIDQFAKLGYEWDVVWNNGATSYELELYMGGNQGTDRSTDSDVAIVDGASLAGGQTTRRRPRGTHILAFGPGGNMAQSTDSDMDGAWGRREAAIITRDALDVDAVEDEADAHLAQFADQTLSLTATIDDTAQVLPVKHFQVGDLVRVVRSDLDVVMRVEKIQSQGRSDRGEYVVDFGSRAFRDDGAAIGEAVSRLLDEYRPLIPDDEGDASGLFGDAVTAAATPATRLAVDTYMIAPFDARPGIRAVADFLCSGESDNVQVQEMVDLAVTEGLERVVFVFAAGQFRWAAGSTVDLGSLEGGIVHFDMRGAEFEENLGT